jgi:DNA-binding NarL/FixJ family response regulator
MNNEIRLILADDHPIVRQGLRQVIEREPDLIIVAEADDGLAALGQTVDLRPDVAVIDVDMPGMDGITLLGKLRESGCETGVIILTVHCEEEFFDRALKAGARGYLVKDSAIGEIVTGIRTVASGGNYISPVLTSYLFNRSRVQPEIARSLLTELTGTEKLVLRSIAEYKTNQQIADELFISPLTVKTHRQNISIKVGLKGKHALMKFALDNRDEL